MRKNSFLPPLQTCYKQILQRHLQRWRRDGSWHRRVSELRPQTAGRSVACPRQSWTGNCGAEMQSESNTDKYEASRNNPSPHFGNSEWSMEVASARVLRRCYPFEQRCVALIYSLTQFFTLSHYSIKYEYFTLKSCERLWGRFLP